MDNLQTEIQREEEMRSSGQYPVVNLNIFDAIAYLELSDWTLEHEQDVLEKYTKYLDDINNLSKTKKEQYLHAIKKIEIQKNHSLEQEDPYMLTLYMEGKRQYAIDYLLKNQKYPLDTLTREKIIVSHKKLLDGTSSQKYIKNDYRQDNLAYVCKSGRGDLQIHYFSLPCEDIEESIMNLTVYYNSTIHDNYTLIKPTIIHGLVGALQVFNDGNTRFARTLQALKTYELTERNLGYYFPTPAFYTSDAYFDYREQYRNKIADIAINPDNESWNNWVNFNLNRIENQIFYMDNKVKKFTKS